MNSVAANGFTSIHSRRLFQLLVPPMYAMKLVDIPIAGAYKLLGYLTIISEPFGRVTGASMLQLDRFL